MTSLVAQETFKYLLTLLKRSSLFESVVMESTQEILSRLKVISFIQKGQKLASRNMILQDDGWTTRITRTWISPDNRHNTLKLIREVITRSFEILIHNISSTKESDIIQCRLIIQDLFKCQEGIINLKCTYSDDVKFGCDLEILLQQISSRLAEIKKTHSHLFNVNHLQEHIPPDSKDNSL